MVSLEIDTIFDCKSISRNQNFIFILMPFEPKLDKTYDVIIKPVVESKGLACERADNLKTSNAIIKDQNI